MQPEDRMWRICFSSPAIIPLMLALGEYKGVRWVTLREFLGLMGCRKSPGRFSVIWGLDES